MLTEISTAVRVILNLRETRAKKNVVFTNWSHLNVHFIGTVIMFSLYIHQFNSGRLLLYCIFAALYFEKINHFFLFLILL